MISKIKFLFKQASLLRRHPVITENLPIVAIVAAYVLALYGTHAFFNIHGKVVLQYYSLWFARFSFFFMAIFFFLTFPKKSYKNYLTPNHVAGFFVILLLAPLFKSAFASFKQTIPVIHDFCWDNALMRADYIIHFGHHPWRLLEPMLSHRMVLKTFDFFYMLWFPVLFIFCLWMAWTQRRRLRLQFFVATLLVWCLLGSGLGTIFSSAGPCYYSHVVHTGDNPFAPLMQRLFYLHHSGFLWAVRNQVGLWQAQSTGIWLPFGGVSAMPSIHLSMAAIFAMAAFNVHKWLGVIFTGYLFIIQIGSVILGWHYAVDGYAGILLAFLIWKGVGPIANRGAVERPSESGDVWWQNSEKKVHGS